MERDIEKDLIEIEAAIRSQVEKDNTFTVSVLQRCHQLVSELARYKRTGLTPEKMLALDKEFSVQATELMEYEKTAATNQILEKYKAIGTIEEFREAMEKQKKKRSDTE